MSGRPVKHSVTLKGHRTSVSLEDEFWNEFRDLADEMDMPINALVAPDVVELDNATTNSAG